MYNAHCPTHSHKFDDPPKKSLDNIINMYHCKVIRNENNKNIIQENKKSCYFERNQVSKKFTILQKSKHISRAQQQHKAAKL